MTASRLFGMLMTAAFLVAGAPSWAQRTSLDVEGAWSRASLAPSRPGVLYLTITNSGGDPVTLTGIETDVAAMSAIHRTTMSEGVSKMEPAGPIEIAPGESVSLEPGGLHGMLMDPTTPLAEGDSFSATLLFGEGDPVEIRVPVLGVTATGPQE